MYSLTGIANGGRPVNILKSAESGKNVVILGNGPSINEMNFSDVKNSVFIGLNGSAIVSRRKGIVEKYYVLSDKRFVQDEAKLGIIKDNVSSKTNIIIRRELFQYLPELNGKRSILVRSLGRDGFSFDLNRGFYFGCTTTMLALQLAAFLGAKNIYLCGVDLKYNMSQPRFYREKKVAEIDNFSCVQIHNIREAYKSLKNTGVNLYNCSPNSLLEPYLPYYDMR